jgi:hypothetical protein
VYIITGWMQLGDPFLNRGDHQVLKYYSLCPTKLVITGYVPVIVVYV